MNDDLKRSYMLLFLIVVVMTAIILISFNLDDRITELEEKAKHFRCLEKRIERLKPVRIKDNTGGAWYIVVDSLDLEAHYSPPNND